MLDPAKLILAAYRKCAISPLDSVSTSAGKPIFPTFISTVTSCDHLHPATVCQKMSSSFIALYFLLILNIQYCAKVMQTNFDEIRGFSWHF